MDLFCELKAFYRRFSGVKGVIGTSEQGRPLYFVCVRKTDYPIVIAQYAIHAREYVTSYLALKQAEDYLLNGKFGTVYFIPLVNPDGVKVCMSGKPFYKANSRGVDLNVNFDALWGKGKLNKTVKGDSDYVGERPFSEKETRALRDFTFLVKPDVTISYHSKGEEIYYEFGQAQTEREKHRLIAERVASVTGYEIKSTPNSCGGYKDWCIDKLNIPALTIEVGDDRLSHPITKDHLNDIYQKNKCVINAVTEIMNEFKIYGRGN